MRTAPVLAYLAICFIWGSTFLGIRIADETLPPFTMIGLRSVLAGAILTAAALATGAARPTPQGLARAALTGTILFFGGQAVLAWGEVRVPSGQASVLNATLALFLPFCTWALGTSRFPRPIAIAGLLLGFAGVAVLARPGPDPIDPVGGLATVGAAFSFALGSAVTRKAPPTRSIFLTAGLQMLFGGLADLAVGGAVGEFATIHPSLITARSIAAFFYLVVMGSLIAFAAFSWLVQIWPPDRLATYTFINPVVALALGTLVGEPIGGRELVAITLILAAVALVMREKPDPSPAICLEEG